MLWVCFGALWREAWVRLREEDLHILARHNSRCPGMVWRTESEGASGYLFFPAHLYLHQRRAPGLALLTHPWTLRLKPKLIPSSLPNGCLNLPSIPDVSPCRCPADRTECRGISCDLKNTVLSEDTHFTLQTKPAGRERGGGMDTVSREWKDTKLISLSHKPFVFLDSLDSKCEIPPSLCLTKPIVVITDTLTVIFYSWTFLWTFAFH